MGGLCDTGQVTSLFSELHSLPHAASGLPKVRRQLVLQPQSRKKGRRKERKGRELGESGSRMKSEL